MTSNLRSYDEVLSILQGLWEEVLETTIEDPGQDFFQLGGDSVLALIIASRAGEAGLTLPPSGVLRRPTLHSLTEAVLDPHRFDDW